MSNDISEPVPQGSDGAQDAENSRIAAIANELERLCAIHEAQFRDGQKPINHFEVEQHVAEQYAKENRLWIPINDVFELVRLYRFRGAYHYASLSAAIGEECCHSNPIRD